MEDDRLAKWLAETYKNSKSNEESGLTEIINTIDQFSIDPIDEDRLFDKIQQQKDKLVKPAKTYTLRWISAIAASLALILGIHLLFFQQASILSPYQEIASHTLPDGSEVKLNSNSRIEYDKKFDHRELTLDGEAFFEVGKGSQFIVNTKHGTIEVLGTSFNIFSRDSFLIVSCATGKVKVKTTTDSQILAPGQKVKLSADKLILESIAPDLIQSWTGNETKFEKTSLSVVLSALSHYYNINIDNQSLDISSLEFTGSFLHDDLNKAVTMVLIPFNIKYELVNEKELVLYQ